jgi:uncharacterized SAM-binding protein YcdF (DUF218 family)
VRRRLVLALPLAWLLACGVLAAIILFTGMVDQAVRSDVIIVLGAAISDEGGPGKALTRRSEHAAELWRRGQAPMIICTGGVGAEARIRRSEADGCREVLMHHGVPRDRIVLEETSRSTEENARNARDIMVARGWTRAILVSDSYHVFRARLLFRRLGVDVVLSPVTVARIGSPLFYLFSVVREVGALHAQLFR